MMEKSRKRRGRLTRLGWSLAIVLLITPAHAIAGVEWTMQSAPSEVERTQPLDDEGRRLDRTLDGARRWIETRDDGSIFELRGSEWT
jgi:hypothetical protein